jgi:hypothetical protein
VSGRNPEHLNLSNGKHQVLPKLRKFFSENFQLIKLGYGEGTLGHSGVFKWHKGFAHGRDSLRDDKRTFR